MSARSFDLDDFRKQIDQMKKLGSVGELLNRIPGVDPMLVNLDDLDTGDEVRRIQGMIDSMTADERRNPSSIDPSRSRRIAVGAGVQPPDVSQLLRQFHGMAAMVRQMSRMSLHDKILWMIGLGPKRSDDPEGPGRRWREW